uniref:Uncharacterized protein n=1 Tax=Physcomitrium patens TaxID=3218 RepID=A0A2K1JIY1_PHYPA|nr:hypothetical protein PHYPA_018689 [Physcomitrium patens]
MNERMNRRLVETLFIRRGAGGGVGWMKVTCRCWDQSNACMQHPLKQSINQSGSITHHPFSVCFATLINTPGDPAYETEILGISLLVVIVVVLYIYYI